MIRPMKQAITSITVFREGDNPVFGESRTKVSLDDEAAGFFVVLEQEQGSLRFDFDEFEEIVKAVNQLKQVDEELSKEGIKEQEDD